MVSAASTMSAKSAHSLWMLAGPLVAAMMGISRSTSRCMVTVAAREDAIPGGGLAQVAQTFAVYVGHEAVAGAGEDEHAVAAIFGDFGERTRELLLHRPRKGRWPAVLVEA